MSEKQNLEIHHDIAGNVSTEHSEEVPDLYVCLDECYVYSTTGDVNGNPRDDADILYDTVPDEILQLEVENRKGKYVRCVKPVEGWVFLPEFDVQYDWADLDEIYQEKKRIRDEEKAKENAENKKDTDVDEDGYMMQGIDEKTEITQEDYGGRNTGGKTDDSHLLIAEDRRNYGKQRMMMQTIAPEIEAEPNKAMQIKFLAWLVFYFRRHPFLPGLIILIIQLVIETIILFDVYSDGRLAMEIFASNDNILFMISSAFIAAPYVIAWTAASAMNAKKLKQRQNNICQIIGCMLFNIAPIGIFFLLVVDVYHWFECVFIKPIFYLFTCGKQIRTISYGELGYYKLRRVSEIFAEAMPQAVLQLYILISGGAGCSDCTPLTVITALASSFFVLLLWITIIKLEGKKNGMGFVEYVTVIFQGSFNFVEMLPAIERGTSTGEKVNWTMYKFDDSGVGHVAKALNGPSCRLTLLKISKYTIKDLNRFGCRFLGGALSQKEGVDVIISRLEEEIIALFDKYDIDAGKSLDFEEFVHLCLDIKQNMREPCLRSDVFLIYEELADSVAHEVWQLDLQIKIKSSLAYIGLLDYKLPLQHAFETGDLKMISLLMAYQYDEQSEENELEFEYCVAEAVTTGKIREALALCEHKGVPAVVRMEIGRELMACDDDGASDPYVRVSIFDQQKQTKYRKQTLNPNWEENLLFILPFEFMKRVLHNENYTQSIANLKEDENAADIDNFFSSGTRDQTQTTRGKSYAAIDIRHSVVTGLSMPKYAQMAIQNDLKQEYGKDFEFVTASSFADLNATYEHEQEPNMMKQITTDPHDKILSSAAAHSSAENKNIFGGSGQGKTSKLEIRFRVFDHDVDDDDDFMGSHKAKIDMNSDTSEYHKHLQTVALHNNDQPDIKAGSISFRIFLNAVQIYQDHELHYIDSHHKDESIQIFKTEITDAQPQQFGSNILGV